MSKKQSAVSSQQSAPRPGWTICPDCGREYKIGMPHTMFCKAHACEYCGTSFSALVPKNDAGKRICEDCELEAA